MSKEKIMTKKEIEETNKNYLLNLFDYEALEKKKLIKNLEIGSEGFIIKNLRLKKDLTQKELAKETGISENTIYNYENGKTNPTKNNWIKVTNFLEINPNFKETISIMMFIKAHNLNERSKEVFSKKDDIEKLAEKINTFGDDVFKKILLPYCIVERKMRVFEIYNLLNGYNLSKNNLKYNIELKNLNFLEEKETKPYFVIKEKENNSGYALTIDEYINEFLIPLSNFFDCINKNMRDIRTGGYEGKEDIYEEEYKILLNKIITENKEGGSDE